MKIIAFCGSQSAGKSTAADILVSKGFARTSFAESIYQMLSALLGVNVRTLDKQSYGLCGRTIRQMLQLLGTEWGREQIGQDIWVEAMRKRLGHGGYWVIDDLRFTNEYRMLRELGASVVLLTRPGCICDNAHASETEWQYFMPSVVVDNYGDLADFKTKILNLL